MDAPFRSADGRGSGAGNLVERPYNPLPLEGGG